MTSYNKKGTPACTGEDHSPRRRNWKHGVANTVTAIWSSGFGVLGRIASRKVREIHPSGDSRILVMAPHPDDEVVGCGGAISLHKSAGDSVWVVYITDGGLSRALPLTPGQMASRRKQEAEMSCGVLNIDKRMWLGLTERDWPAVKVQNAFRQMLDEFAPDIVYAPSCVDYHPDHVKTACALAQVLSGCCDSALRIRICQLGAPLTAVLVNSIAVIDEVRQTYQQAMDAHQSQWANISMSLRLRGYAGRRHTAGKLVEEFWEVTPEQYVGIHSQHNLALWHNRRVRGLRYWPMTDPLCYLQGKGWRRKLLAGVR